MQKKSLTALAVEHMKSPASGQVTHWDAGSPIGVRVSHGGSKTFIMLLGSGKRKTIGHYPALSLQQAREAARKIAAERTLGIEKPEAPITFDEAVALFLSNCEQRNKPRTVADYRALFRRHFIPKFAKRKLSDISTHDISKIIDALKQTPTEQNHAHTALSIMLHWACRRGYLQASPMARLQLPARVPPRSRLLNDTELKAVYLNADTPVFGSIIRLCILLGQRRSEIGSLRWHWIDTARRTITFPPEVIKNNRTHVIPYGPMAEAILESVPHRAEYLFPGRDRNATFQGWAKCKLALDRASGVSGYTIHDLRRVFSTRVAEHTAPHVLERILNHSTGEISGVAKIYNVYSYMDEMRAAINTWEQRLTALLNRSDR
jgi:integrase